MTKNILLLSMSTIRKNAKKNYYFNAGNTTKKELTSSVKVYECISQLEPGTKYLLSTLAEEQEPKHIDKIIILSTEAVRKPVEIDGMNISAVNYYQKKIKAFLKEKDSSKPTKSTIHALDIDTQTLDSLIENINLDNELAAYHNSKKTSQFLSETHKKLIDLSQKINTDYQINQNNTHNLTNEKIENLYKEAELSEYLNKLMNLRNTKTNIDKYIKLYDEYLEQYDPSKNSSRINKLYKTYYLYVKLKIENEENTAISKELAQKLLELQKQIDDLNQHLEEDIITYIKEGLAIKYTNFLIAHKYYGNTNPEKIAEIYKEIEIEIDSDIDSDNEKFFKQIPLEEGEEYKAISRVVSEILKLKKPDNDKINLFVDMQGGMRTTIFILNAVLNMLRYNNILLKKSTAISFAVTNIFNEITDETKTNRIFDLVSGMDEFINYGKGNKFKEYYDIYKEEKYNNPEKEIPEDKIIKEINNISNAIAICDVDGMAKGLQQLNIEIKKYRTEIDSEEKESLFESLLNNLYKDYEDIFSWNFDTLAIIRWCKKKGLYQQALTLLEAKMPEQMVKDGIIYYCKNGVSNKAKVVSFFLDKYNNLDRHEKYKIQDINHYFLKNWCGEILKETSMSKTDKYIHLIKLGESSTQKLKVYTDIPNIDNLKTLLIQYYNLSSIRNENNHAASKEKRSTLEVINDSLQEFINHYKDCKESIPQVNSCFMVYKDIFFKSTLNKLIANFDNFNENEADKDFKAFYQELKDMRKSGVISNIEKIQKFCKTHPYINELINRNIRGKNGNTNEILIWHFSKNGKGNEPYKALLNSCYSKMDILEQVFQEQYQKS